MRENLPAIIGGNPVRSGSFRTTPERGDLEVRYLDAWVRGASNWEPDAANGGVPVAQGAAIDRDIAEALGWEPAAFAAEFALMQTPRQPRRALVVPSNNGTRIITNALAAISKVCAELGLREHSVGDEVIVPALTWQATAGAVLRRNLVPVLVDVDPDTLCMSVDAVRAAMTARTVAVLPVHLYGRMADVAEISRLVGGHGIAVGEDCAHAHGARYGDGSGAGTLGDFGTFSFQGSKTLAGGEGGALITMHPALAYQVASVVTCGRKVRRSQPLQADNDRMPAVVAALLRAQLERFREQHQSRVSTFAQLDEMAAKLEGIDPLPGQPDVEVPPTYKWLFRVDLSAFSGMSLRQIAAALEAELGCEFATLYEPLTDSPLYNPWSDPALHLSAEFKQRIDPREYAAPVAVEAYRTTLAVEHAAGLDPNFPVAFAEAVEKIRAHSARLAQEVGA